MRKEVSFGDATESQRSSRGSTLSNAARKARPTVKLKMRCPQATAMPGSAFKSTMARENGPRNGR